MNNFDTDFVITSKDLNKDEYIVVRYRFETAGDFETAAIALAKEQSFSTIEDPVREKEMIGLYGAKVVMDTVGPERRVKEPTLPSFVHDEYEGDFVSREVDLAYPARLFSGSLMALVSMVIGEVHNIAQFTGIKVVDVTFPDSWKEQYGGPAFGVEGIREYLNKPEGPILISPVKPCVGLSAQEFADRVYECLKGGFDGVKDDELLLDPDYCPFEERVTKVMERIRQVEEETGKKKIYFANIGGDYGEIDRMFKFAIEAGVSGIMFSPLINGLDIIAKYKGKVPIIAHNNLTHGMTRHPLLGISFSLWVKLQRLVGADMAICPAPDRSFYVMSKETNKNNVRKATEENGLRMTLLGLSGSQTPQTLFEHGKYLNHDNYAICPGGAVYEHPDGIGSGAASFVAAADALANEIDIQTAAETNSALAASIEKFTTKSFDR